MDTHINTPVPGWYEITGAKHPGRRKKLRQAGYIYRECMCNERPHEWRDGCTRYPHHMAGRIDGQDVDALAVWHATGRTPITEIEALSLMGQENVYV